ncbi:MAG: bifunctional riboflavin kinase/FAD synthetase [Acidobacteriota bacterium]
MQVIHDATRSAYLPYGVVATIGNYDGVHRGQQAVISKVVERARARGSSAVVITFQPHPVSVLRPDAAPQLLTLDRQRETILESLGVDALLIVRFTKDFANTTAEAFVRDFLHRQLALEELYVGSEFGFGKQRGGDVDLLRRIGDELGFTVEGIDEELYRGDVISSTRVRSAVRDGQVELALELLGRPYGLLGTVVRGDRMGQKLGWPTINLLPENEILPQDGVYCGRARFTNLPGVFDCVTNVGTRPTVYENYDRVVESHLLGFSADVYGEEVEVCFYKRLREERLFPSVMDLSAQIARDVEAAREYFTNRRRLEAALPSGV